MPQRIRHDHGTMPITPKRCSPLFLPDDYSRKLDKGNLHSYYKQAIHTEHPLMFYGKTVMMMIMLLMM